MSTDLAPLRTSLAPVEPAGPAPAGRPRFEVLALSVLLGLVLLATGLTVANAVRGPRVVAVTVDATRAATVADQRWVLDLDQPVQAADLQAQLSPEVPITVAVEARRVTVRLHRALDLGTTYTLRITARGSGTHGTSTLVERLTTPPAQTFLLQRSGPFGGGGSDRVLRTDVRSGQQDVVFSGPAIQQVASAPPYLAVVRSDGDDGRASLATVRLGEDDAPVPVVSGSVVRQVRGSGPGGLFAFVTVEPGTDGPAQLHVLDPATGRTGTVLGSDRQPIDASEWRFVPGTNQLVVQTPNLEVWLVDPWNRTPVRPLGGHPYLVDFVPGTKELLVDDATLTVLDLGTGQRRKLAPPDAPADQIVYQSWTLPDPDPHAMLVSRLDRSGDTTSDLALVLGAGAGRRTVWQSPAGSTLARTCLSPNGQLLELDVAPSGARPDDYPIVSGALGTTTTLVDLSSGRTYGPFPGFASTWCS